MPPAAGRGDNPYHAALLRRLRDLRGRVPPAGDGGVVLPRTRAAAGGGGDGGGGDDDVAGLAIPDLDVRALRSAAAAARDWALLAANGATAGAVPGLAPGEAFGCAAAAVDAHTLALVTLGRGALWAAATAAAAAAGDAGEEAEVVAAAAAAASASAVAAASTAATASVAASAAAAATAAADLAITGRVYDDFFALADTLTAGAVLVNSFPAAFTGAAGRTAGRPPRGEGGAWPYIGAAHEVPVYHAINVAFLASYWVLAGGCGDDGGGGGGGGGGDNDDGGGEGRPPPCVDARAEIAASAAWYLTALTAVGGFPEWASSPSWKAQWPNAGTDAWNAHTVGLATLATIRDASRRGAAAAVLPADMTVTAAGCNLALYPRPDVRLGAWADALLRAGLPATDVAAASPAVPDGQTLADAGLGGPRGRYGRVMTVLAGRDVTAGGAGRPDSQTNAGAVVAAVPGAAAGLPLEAALLAAYPLLWTEPAAAGEGTWRTPAAHVAPPLPAPAVRVVVGRAVGGLAASHGLGGVGTGPVGGPAAPGWAARQLWVSLSDRLVGVLSVGVAEGGVDDHDDDGGGGAAAFGVAVRLRVGAGVLPSGGADGGGLDTTLRPLPSSAAVGRAGGRAGGRGGLGSPR
ncbi:hypothetical protein I4F81_004916 [Pyropia yezoensis]|uniref:Uncharacterized protein n=1 Tax=Pyropia yezoensis TaxID=2788 RepID=A0ACC3BWS6_PYRYE|nr:hypothetical protein I4F81_004916 [Neopyropia yezoensis]